MFKLRAVVWNLIVGVVLMNGLTQPLAADEESTTPELEITVGERIDLGSVPSNSAVFMVTRNGTWILSNKRSTDQGQTWEVCTMLGEARCQLRDGTIVAVAGVDSGGDRSASKKFSDDVGRLRVHFSRDDWASVETIEAPVHIPLAREFHPVRGLIELDDGRLLLTMYGTMKGDTIRENAGCGGMPSHFKTRVIVVESSDRGQSWRYLATVSYNPHLGGPEGQNESDIIQLPSGQLCAFMRTGMHGYVDHVDKKGQVCRDEALLMALSDDQGRYWRGPEQIHVGGKLIAGIYPRALLTDDGVLAVLRCRPDGSVVFSPDGGTVWTDEVIHYEPIAKPGVPYHASMQDMALIGPNTILVVDIFTPKGWPPTDGWWSSFRAEGVPITVKKK